MHEKPTMFVEQRELPFVASPCNLPSLRYSLLEITSSFENTQSVSILRKGLLSVMAEYGGSE